MSEVAWVVDRARLYHLRQAQPHWSKQELARCLNRSLSWVVKWLQRFEAADPNDPQVFRSQSRARKTPNHRVTPVVEEAILTIRDKPPQALNRVPGPRTILYYLQQQAAAIGPGHYLPTSTATIWRILDKHQRIHRPQRPQRKVEARPAPLTHWQIDFKTVSSVPPEAAGKQQHVVETLNIVDKGTSLLLAASPRADYNAETAILTLVAAFMRHGLPDVITFDRDPRFVGAWSAKEFPTPFMRFLMCLGIRVDVCPPHRPDRNAFVERFHRSYEYECLAIHRPTTLAETIACTATYQHHYNWHRPHQALTCGNRPPRLAFPTLPPRPALPTKVDPDSWLQQIHGTYYRRRVDSSGHIQIGRQRYYISQALKRQSIVLRVDAPQQRLLVFHDNELLRSVSLKGLYHSPLLLEDFIPLMQAEAVSDYRRYWRQRPTYH